ncbi:hypothetical protein PMIN04_006852 [Paraphaeosphaeria minitans]|uniref:Uncharacterized protein n=1 Tax=Paraphaeosphaeria minitans TaxID=565426 RepID=A0A9P6KR52_9PLEO|nr:hypothetical protein PMIN01_04272 [Paraphaeosphaeria minitans]
MSETRHAFLNERLRLALSGHIPGHQLDRLIASLSHLFKTVRPDLTPSKVLIAVSEPSVCGSQYCSCHSADSILQMYKITVFMDRKERGRRVTKPWVRAGSMVGFEKAAEELIRKCGTLVSEAQDKKREVEEEAERKKKATDEEAESRRKVLGAERFETKGAGLLEGFEKMKGRERGFTVPSKGFWSL